MRVVTREGQGKRTAIDDMKRRKFVSSLAAAALAPLTAHAKWNPDVNQKYQRNESPAITFDVIVIIALLVARIR